MLTFVVAFIVLSPFFIISYYNNWPVGIFGNSLYFLIAFRLAGRSEQRWEKTGHLALLTFPFIYSLFLVLGPVLTACLLFLTSGLSTARLYFNYKELLLTVQLSKHWEPFTVYFPEETPNFTFEGTVQLNSVVTNEPIDMPAKRFLLPITYTVNGVPYQQEYDFLWTSFKADPNDVFDYQSQVAGQSLTLYYNPKKPLEVRRPPSEHYDAKYIDGLLQVGRSHFIAPILWGVIGISLLIIGLFYLNFQQ